MPRLISAKTSKVGITIHPKRAKINVIIGAKRKSHRFAGEGRTDSFKRSLAASAMGCNKPKKPTTLGPTRRCIAARTLRSTRVKKATEIKMGSIKESTLAK